MEEVINPPLSVSLFMTSLSMEAENRTTLTDEGFTCTPFQVTSS